MDVTGDRIESILDKAVAIQTTRLTYLACDADGKIRPAYDPETRSVDGWLTSSEQRLTRDKLFRLSRVSPNKYTISTGESPKYFLSWHDVKSGGVVLTTSKAPWPCAAELWHIKEDADAEDKSHVFIETANPVGNNSFITWNFRVSAQDFVPGWNKGKKFTDGLCFKFIPIDPSKMDDTDAAHMKMKIKAAYERRKEKDNLIYGMISQMDQDRAENAKLVQDKSDQQEKVVKLQQTANVQEQTVKEQERQIQELEQKEDATKHNEQALDAMRTEPTEETVSLPQKWHASTKNLVALCCIILFAGALLSIMGMLCVRKCKRRKLCKQDDPIQISIQRNTIRQHM